MYADGGAGFVIADESGMESAYETALAYAPYMQFTTRPVLTIEDALPTIAAWMSSGARNPNPLSATGSSESRSAALATRP